jgi:ABC-type transporter Mla subunit MlaD
MVVLGELVTKFTSDMSGLKQGVGQYDKEIATAEKKTADFNTKLDALKTTALEVAAGIGVATAIIAGFIVKATGYADALTDASYATGLTVEQLQRFKAAGTQVGVSFDEITTTARMMTARMGEVADPSSEMSKSLKSIGVSAYDTNGNLKDTNTLMWDIINGLAQQPAGIERNSKALAILGRSWYNIAPMINEAAEAQEAYNKADPFSDKKIATLHEYQIALDKAGAASDRWAVTIGDKLTPLITAVFIPAIEAAGGAVDWLSKKWDEMQFNAAKNILATQAFLSGDSSKYDAFVTAGMGGGAKGAASSTGSANAGAGAAPSKSNWAEDVFGGTSQGKVKTTVDLLDDVGSAMEDLKEKTDDVADAQKKLNDLTKKYAETQEDLDRTYSREMSMVDPRDASAVRNEEDLAIQQSRDTSTANEDIATAKGAQAEAAAGVGKAAGDLIINIDGKLVAKSIGVISLAQENKSMGVPNR